MFAFTRKVVIPVAGLGSRTLPATKAIPKELLQLYDRPFMGHVVKEAIALDITVFMRATRSGNRGSALFPSGRS